MAPAAAVAFSIIFAVTYAGGATPLAILLALVGCLFCAISIGQLARHLPSAGGPYTDKPPSPPSRRGLLRRVGIHAGGAPCCPAALPHLRERSVRLPCQPLRNARVVVGAVCRDCRHRGMGPRVSRGSDLHRGGA